MKKNARPARLLAFSGLLAALAVALARPAPALASCMPLDLAKIERTSGRVVFAGTVVATEGTATRMRVEQWYLGSDPQDLVVVAGGRGSSEPNVVTSVDWSPQPGQAYLVVAERDASGQLKTEACQQAAATAEGLRQAASVFGEPDVAPFASPGPSPTGAGESRQPSAPGAALDTAVLAAAGLAGVGAVALLVALGRRRAASSR